jgi:hypothetical protein
MIAIFCYSFCNAQQDRATTAQWAMEHAKEIKSTSYIIEGTIIQQKKFHAPNHEVFTCSVILITRIYKGSPELKLGTIKVLLDDEYAEVNGGLAAITYDAGRITLNKGGTYVILGAPTAFNPDDTSMIHSMITDNTITLALAADPVVIGKTTAQWDETTYSPVDSLYSFFKENGITVQEEAPTGSGK